jgi:Zn-dependent protease
MFSSLKLGKVFGIDLYVHATFWLLPLIILFGGASAGDLSGAAFDVAVVFAIFGCVVLHEVGHALAARYYGIRTRDITLYPIGGAASLERMPERPLHEIVVALAGPAVNVVIAMGIVAGLIVGNMAMPLAWDPATPDIGMVFLARLLLANVLLVAFNLIPAFPMDGGRVFRALLSTSMPRVQATQAAASVASVIAAGFVMLGVGSLLGITGQVLPPILGFLDSPMLAILGVFIYVIGQAELAGVRAQVFAGPAVDAEVERDDPFTGWRWDPARRVWTQWRDGVLVREVHI